jgi:hypothetical protein
MWISLQQVNFCIYHIREKKKREYNEAALQPFIDLKKVYHSFRRDVLCNVIIESGIPMTLVRLINKNVPERYL